MLSLNYFFWTKSWKILLCTCMLWRISYSFLWLIQSFCLLALPFYLILSRYYLCVYSHHLFCNAAVSSRLKINISILKQSCRDDIQQALGGLSFIYGRGKLMPKVHEAHETFMRPLPTKCQALLSKRLNNLGQDFWVVTCKVLASCVGSDESPISV